MQRRVTQPYHAPAMGLAQSSCGHARQGIPSAAVATLADNLTKLARVREILDRAARANVPVLVLKGTALLGWLYGLHERRMADVDVLIDVRDIERFLSALDWPAPAPAWALTAGAQRAPNEVPFGQFTTAFRTVELDIHFRLANPLWLDRSMSQDVAGLWARAQECEIGGARALRLSTEDQLLHLAVHGVHGDLECSPRTAEDISRLVLRAPPDWGLFVRLAKQQQVRMATWLALSSLGQGELVPDWVMAELLPPSHRRLLLALAHRLKGAGDQSVWPMLLTDSLTGSIRGAALRLVPPPWWLRARYPELAFSAPLILWHWWRILSSPWGMAQARRGRSTAAHGP